MPSHTPGPWEYHFEEPNREWVLVMSGGKSGQIVANVNTSSCPDSSSAPAFRVMPAEANARLIASAPELLAELREVSAQYNALLQAHGKPFGWGFLATQKARELIAHIEGKPTEETPSLPPPPSIDELHARADKLGARFASDARVGCWNYYDRNNAHAFCVSLREVAELIASDENSRQAEGTQ